MKQRVETYEELQELVNDLSATQKFIVDVHQPAGDSGYIVQWQEHKKYVAQDGVEYPDEAWITEAGDMKLVQDLEPEHCRNILRLILRQEREAMNAVEQLTERLSEAIEGISNEDFTAEDIKPNRVLH